MNGTSHGQFAKAVGEALANRGFSVQKIDNYSSTDVNAPPSMYSYVRLSIDRCTATYV